MLVLDEMLGLVDHGLIEETEHTDLILAKPSDIDLILTGRVLGEGIRPYIDEIYHLVQENGVDKGCLK